MKNKDFAVIEIGSKQYLVKQNELLKVDRLPEKPVVNVLLSNIDNKVEIGEPFVEKVGVEMEVLEDRKDKKVPVRRYKSKSRYRRNVGHRQPISMLKVTKIGVGVKSVVKRKKVKKEDK